MLCPNVNALLQPFFWCLGTSDHEPGGASSRDTAWEDDRTLVQQLTASNEDVARRAFEIVFRRYAGPLCDYAVYYVASRDDAEDMVQQLFLKFWRGRTTRHIAGTLAEYLYLSVRNATRDWAKHARVVQRHANGLAHDESTEQQLIDMERTEREAQLTRAIAELPPRRRAICLLRWVEGLRYAEIARRLGVSEKTVANQITQALRTLRAADLGD
jgi:RNA polymerase sigma-70 factor (family 1)